MKIKSWCTSNYFIFSARKLVNSIKSFWLKIDLAIENSSLVFLFKKIKWLLSESFIFAGTGKLTQDNPVKRSTYTKQKEWIAIKSSKIEKYFKKTIILINDSQIVHLLKFAKEIFLNNPLKAISIVIFMLIMRVLFLILINTYVDITRLVGYFLLSIIIIVGINNNYYCRSISQNSFFLKSLKKIKTICNIGFKGYNNPVKGSH